MRGGPWAGSSGIDRWLRGEQAHSFAEELVLKTQINNGFSAVQEQGEEGNLCLSSLAPQISAVPGPGAAMGMGWRCAGRAVMHLRGTGGVK